MAADWSKLPPELLFSIAGKLTIHIDYIRFRSVCVNFRSSTPATPHHLPCQLPWLMIPQSRNNQTHRRPFFSLCDNKFHFLNLPEASHRRRHCGSSHGWLVIVEESPAIFLLNPLTRSKVHLPPLSSFPNVVDFNFYNVGREYTLRSLDGGDLYFRNLREMRDSFIKKVVLSSTPSNDCDFVALAIINQTGDLAFCKKGEQCWKFIENAQSYCEDAIYNNGLFYAVNKIGVIAVCDVNSPTTTVSIIDTVRVIGGDSQYLVCSENEFLLATRYIDSVYDDYLLDVYNTTQFQVYRLDLSGPKWERVTSLVDRMLFLGENSSLALLASDFPGCKGNCIYYTDDYSESNYDGDHGDHDLGVYYLEDGRIEQLPCYPRMSYSWPGRPPPIWVTPNPC